MDVFLPDYRIEPIETEDGNWMLASEVYAEIVRLRTENERLKQLLADQK